MPNNRIITKKDFKYSKSYVNTLLGCSIFFIIFAIASRFLFKGQPGAKIGYFCFDLFALTAFLVYVYYKTRRIVYSNQSFVVYGLIRKKTYRVSEILTAVERPLKGVVIKFNNNKKIIISPFMTNYSYVKTILKQCGIEIKKVV